MPIKLLKMSLYFYIQTVCFFRHIEMVIIKIFFVRKSKEFFVFVLNH